MAPDDAVVLAHGLGGPQDLPLPAPLAVAGAVAALLVSFGVLSLAWRAPRYDGPAAPRGRRLRRLTRVVDHPAYAWVLRLVGLALFGFTAYAAILGPDTLLNPFFGIVYVLLWVGLVPASLLLGPVYRAISPVRTLHLLLAKVSGSEPEEGLTTYPARLGLWPAAFGLLVFVWLELVYPGGDELGPLRLAFAVYVGAMIIGGAVFGSTFFERADPFEVYSSLVARMSVWGRDDDGVLVVRSPLANLARTRSEPGLVAVVAVLLGSTAYDSMKDAPWWLVRTQFSTNEYLYDHLGLAGLVVLVGAAFWAATVAVRPAEGERWWVPGLLAPSLVPIVVGYVVAHYATFLVRQGQLTLILASDPLGDGSNLFGTARLQVADPFSSQPTLVAVLQVAGVVLGHVVAVVAAHDRSIALLPPRRHLTGQLPLLAVMVGFTVGGLFLLFAA